MSRRSYDAGSVALVAVLAMLVVLTGCAGPTFNSLPLPGTKVSGPTVDFTARFDEALNLTDGAQIRVNGVDSGRVQSVSVRDFHAVVAMKVKKAAQLHQGATARLRYTTPLGELFVDVTNPSTGAPLPSGAVLSDKETSTAPTVEDALSSTSMLINGGGLAQLQVITDESNKILGGREGTIRDLLERSTYFAGQINASKGDIDRTLTSLNGVAKILHQRRTTIRTALTDIRPASRVIRANLEQITTLLTQLTKFADTANGVVGATRVQILQLIRQAGPLLQELASVRTVLPATLQALIRTGQQLDKVIPGDYLNLGTHLHLDKGVLGTGTPIGTNTLPGLGSLPGGLPDLSGLATQVTQGITGGLLGGTTSGSSSGGLLGGLLGGGQ